MIPVVESTMYGAALVFGFRHGFDWDHIAALTDLTGSQRSPRRSMLLATLYACGHAVMVIALGVLAIVFAARIPNAADAAMERVVGVTLIALAAYITWALVRYRGEPVMRSRWMLVVSGLRRLVARRRRTVVVEHSHPHDHGDALHGHHHHPDAVDRDVTVFVQDTAPTTTPVLVKHTHRHRHVAPMPTDPFATYTPRVAFGVGALHGIGAESPTQVMLFVAAAGASGTMQSVELLVCFAVGVLVSNTIVAAASTVGFRGLLQRRRVYLVLSIASALLSLVIGSLFLLGWSDSIPTIVGG